MFMFKLELSNKTISIYKSERVMYKDNWEIESCLEGMNLIASKLVW